MASSKDFLFANTFDVIMECLDKAGYFLDDERAIKYIVMADNLLQINRKSIEWKYIEDSFANIKETGEALPYSKWNREPSL